jgi:hypothetical protein
MSKAQTLHTKIADEPVSVKVIFEHYDEFSITIRVKTREDALVTCYCYRGQTTKIERTSDGEFLVIVYKEQK